MFPPPTPSVEEREGIFYIYISKWRQGSETGTLGTGAGSCAKYLGKKVEGFLLGSYVGLIFNSKSKVKHPHGKRGGEGVEERLEP